MSSSRGGASARLRSIRSIPGPFAVATTLTAPSRPDRIEDPVVSGLQWARTAVGIVATVWLLMAYPLAEGREQFVMGKVEDLLIGSGLTLVVGFVAVTAFIVAARSPLGRRYAARLAGPLSSLGAIALGAGAAWLMVKMLKGDIISTADVGYHGILVGLLVVALFIIGGLVCALALVFAVLFTLVALVHGLNSCFRLGDVHELLPALISPLLVWSLFVLGLFDGPDVAAPPVVLYTFLLGGPVSVTALSVWEVRRLRTRHGMTLRGALGR
ncbi:hypothetical protein [Streptomyces sp. Caat 7-52]|uniref:hypothetical protein n=1 Tax=Streptomyces sp. Caat 7-52 TaxID=2949637 RepID=UPI0020358527|nr:hypothetical protein [Streptomyces sp. Caat 7-52]